MIVKYLLVFIETEQKATFMEAVICAPNIRLGSHLFASCHSTALNCGLSLNTK